MDLTEKIIDKFEGVEWATKKGLFFSTIGILLVFLVIVFAFKKIDITFNQFWLICFLTIIEMVNFLAWFRKRFFGYNLGIPIIVFAIKTEDSSKGYYREIKKRFQEQINNFKLQKKLKIRELSGDICFVDASSAENFIKKKRISLLIWGDTNEGNIKNAPFTQFNINLSYVHGVVNEDRRKKFIDDVGAAAKRKFWGVWKPESFYQLIVVSGNVVEISLYTLGACLATMPNLDCLLGSVDIFEKLDLQLKNRNQDDNFPNLQLVKKKVKKFLRDIYNCLLIFYWNTQADLNRAIYYADKAIKIDENNFIAHNNMAFFQWLKGEKDLAIYHTNRAWDIRPGHPLPRLNRAFFHFSNRRFDLGLREYKKVNYVGDTNIINVIEFLEKEFEKDLNNLGFLFITGWLNIQYGDQIRGSAQLKDFLLKSNNNVEYSILIEEVGKVLKEVN